MTIHSLATLTARTADMARELRTILLFSLTLFNYGYTADTQNSFDVSYPTIIERLSSFNEELKQTTTFKSKMSTDFDSAEAILVSFLSNMKVENRQTLQNYLTDFTESQSKQEFLTKAKVYKISSQCLHQSTVLVEGLIGRQNWAWRMIDSAGKPPSGLLNFNLNWWGLFDECMAVVSNVTNPEDEFKGKYCTVNFPLGQKTAPNPAGAAAAMSMSTGLNIGMCFPDGCSNSDTKALMNAVISMLPVNQSIVNMLEVGKSTCELAELEYDSRAIAVLVVISLFVLIMIVATAYDIILIQWPKQRLKEYSAMMNGDLEYKNKIKGENQPLLGETTAEIVQTEPGILGSLLLSFSIYSNGVKILSTNQPPGSLTAVHGIRFMSMSWVILGHSAGFGLAVTGVHVNLLLSFSVFSNGKKILSTQQGAGSLSAINGIRFLSMAWVILGHTYVFGMGSAENVLTFLPAVIKRWTFHAILNALVSVDSFFTLSGLLLSYLTLREMKKNNGKLNWGMFYFHRFWRLTPPYMLLMMVYVPLGKYFSDGPKYPQTGFEMDYCKDSWWTNLLYVNNLVRVDKMCMGWSWYLANDMQFFVVSPLLLIPLYFLPALGIVICIVFILAVFICAGVISSVNDMPPTMFGGGGLPSGALTYFKDYYITPYCRMGPYVVGIFTGYMLYRMECRCKINRYLNLFIWLVAATFACLVLYGLYDPLNGHPLSSDVSALYNATNRTVWGACLCWVVFACATGNGGYVNTLMSWKALIPLSRLTYCGYLVHPIIMYTYYFSVRTPLYITDFTMIMTYLGFLVLTFMAAFVISLAFESPMMGLEKIVFKRPSSNKSQ